jgi:glyoxalase family protein
MCFRSQHIQEPFDIKEASMPVIHRASAIAGDPLKNLSFYTRDLGLPFTQQTVKLNEPSTCWFYCGDETR